jgi:plasmid stability protein
VESSVVRCPGRTSGARDPHRGIADWNVRRIRALRTARQYVDDRTNFATLPLKGKDIMIALLPMAQLIVRNLEDDIRNRLRALAELHGCSMEEEVRQILRAAVLASDARPARVTLGTRMSGRFASIGLTEELAQLPPRSIEPPSLGQ